MTTGNPDPNPVRAIVDVLRRAHRVLLVAHRPADADGVGSALALAAVLRGMGRDVGTVCQEPLTGGLLSLPGADTVGILEPFDGRSPRWDATVFLDCASAARADLPEGWRAYGGTWINVDHHATNPLYGDLSLVDATAPATAAVVARIVDGLEEALRADAATCLYAGLLTDTQRFTAPSTGPEAHRLAARLLESGADGHGMARALYGDRTPRDLRLMGRALRSLRLTAGGQVSWVVLDERDFQALGVNPEGSEDFADVAAAVAGVRVAVYVRPGAQPKESRIGLRSPDGSVDVGRLALGLGGGGHARSAGCSLAVGVSEAVETLRPILDEVVRGDAG